MRTVRTASSATGRNSLVFLACLGVCVVVLLICVGFSVLAWTLLGDAII